MMFHIRCDTCHEWCDIRVKWLPEGQCIECATWAAYFARKTVNA